MDRLVNAAIERYHCELDLLDAIKAQDKLITLLAKRKDEDGENIRDHWKHAGVAD